MCPAKLPVNSLSIKSPISNPQTFIPAEYQDLSDIFSKVKATQLPPHLTYDYLLPGNTLPKVRINPLSPKEQKAMKEYIQEALAQNVLYIVPSTSPVSAGFFFVENKNGDLRPCIDYRGLNEILVKYPFPLPLVPSALEHLKMTKLFTKLDLRSAYNLIRIRAGDEWKTAFSTT